MRIDTRLAVFVALLSPLGPLGAGTIVFSDLQTNGLLCGCSPSRGSTLDTWPQDPHEHWARADGFMVPAFSNFALDRIQLAAGLISGINALTVSLDSDQNGVPGSPIETIQIDNQMGLFGRDHPLLVAESVLHPLLKAAAQYWLVVATTDPAHTYVGWYVNNVVDLGPTGSRVQRDDFLPGGVDSPFFIRQDLQDAFAVLGTAVGSIPEPSPAWTCSVGFLLLLTGRLLKHFRQRTR